MTHDERQTDGSGGPDIEEEFYWLLLERNTDESAPLFYPHALKSGGIQWRLSGFLINRRDMLTQPRKVSESVKGAVLALSRAERRIHGSRRQGKPQPDFQLNPTRPIEGEMAFEKFLIPFADILSNFDESTIASIRRSKREALEWVANVINASFSGYLERSQAERDAADMIETALLLCQRNNQIPTKADIRDQLCKESGNRWDLAPDTWRLRWLAAGLSKLDQSRGN